MADRHSRFYTMAGPDQYDPPFALYENSFQQPFPRGAPPPPHFENMAYWYRPEPQETVFEHNKMLYNQSLVGVHSPIDQSMGAIKHRRTRSGCFTCRHRRVKCDETRPICERCKKGNRECHFPPTSSSSSRRNDVNEVRNTQSKKSSADAQNRQSHPLEAIDDEDEDVRESSVSPAITTSRLDTNKTRTQAQKSLDVKSKYLKKANAGNIRPQGSPSSTGTTSPLSRTGSPMSGASTPSTTHRHPSRSSRWSQLSSEIQQNLQFHHDKVTRHHYFLKHDPTDFIHNEFIDIALTFEPLLHAVVGFSAYHRALSKPDGRFQDFWKHYCQSIMLLRKWLETDTDRNEAVLLTILQIATFEEYLGDWAGVSSHLKAAYSIFSTLYTYDNIMDNVASRCIFDWIARGDVAVGLMAGTTTILERQWFTVALEWHEEQAEEDDSEPATALPCIIAKLRLLGADIATVHAEAMTMQNASKYILNISNRMESLRADILTLQKTAQSGTNVANVDPRLPLFHGNLWPLNFILIDWYATEQMHKYKTLLYKHAMEARSHHQHTTASKLSPSSTPSLDDVPPELERLSLIQCQIFEAIERNPHAPSGAILGCQASLALASVFLQKAPKYNVWARRKLAKMECMGYVWAPSFRKRMSQLWEDEDVLNWWLPNDELKTDLVDEIRGVAEERNKEINARGGDERDDVREMKAVFDKLEFGKRGPRARKDSVWSTAGTVANTRAKLSTPEDSEESDDEDEDEDDVDEHVESEDEDEDDKDEEPEVKHHNRTESRNSGVGATSSNNTRRAAAAPLPTTLEYSNRMSGIWEG